MFLMANKGRITLIFHRQAPASFSSDISFKLVEFFLCEETK